MPVVSLPREATLDGEDRLSRGKDARDWPEIQKKSPKGTEVPKLKSATRDRLPSSAFGLPKERKYPMEDRPHQIRAKGRATEMERKGKLSPAQAARICAKANRLLGE